MGRYRDMLATGNQRSIVKLTQIASWSNCVKMQKILAIVEKKLKKITYIIKVEENFSVLIAGSLQISDASTENVRIEFLLLNPIAGRNGNVQYGHTRTNGFIQIGPSNEEQKNKLNKMLSDFRKAGAAYR